MLFKFADRRAQNVRNREKARMLIDAHGENTEAYVGEKIVASGWQLRDQEHWQRILAHVKMLSR